MAQYDIYPNPSARSREQVPYVVDVQSNLLADLRTRLVLPLSRAGATLTQVPHRLAPTFVVEEQVLALQPHLAAGIDARLLRHAVSSLADHASELRDAMDAVMSGV
ncbi:MAG: CcdB family protein [Vitreoscilla sp.]|nr:CcdB family protein [Vitreoscilla sp.]